MKLRYGVLLDALQEINRHIESAKGDDGLSSMVVLNAFKGRDSIIAAILTEKDEIGSVAQRTERDGSNIEDAGSIPATPANPALENVLAKLRAIVQALPDGKNTQVLSAYSDPFLTLGDLRRWVESEKQENTIKQADSSGC